MKKQSQSFPLGSLIVVAEGESFRDAREPPHRIGDIVQINSGGPNSVVVDVQDGTTTIAWKNLAGLIEEFALPDICVHRVRNAF